MAEQPEPTENIGAAADAEFSAIVRPNEDEVNPSHLPWVVVDIDNDQVVGPFTTLEEAATYFTALARQEEWGDVCEGLDRGEGPFTTGLHPMILQARERLHSEPRPLSVDRSADSVLGIISDVIYRWQDERPYVPTVWGEPTPEA